MKKFYAQPEMELTIFTLEDIITLSGLTTDIDDDGLDLYTGENLWS
ncbi:MAG: hypothetical protein IJ062_13405 [Firmicutes bacterium]|nr:hypothetical protein [Bacillota bacterium]